MGSPLLGTNAIVIPGQEFDSHHESQSGPSYRLGGGVFERNGTIYASLVGQPVRTGGTISVINPVACAKVPAVGTIVIGMISKIVKLQAYVSIMEVANVPLPIGQEYHGVIRSQDVRHLEKDKVIMANCFRPGDIVRAEVISLPTSSAGYLLATFRNNLGVVFAYHSLTGNQMTAISWNEMRDESTGQKEPRKVAGPSE
ncbi:hypothetical protein O181_008539 [Austropuccinia psidii MF-1]|uniref:S1 motif domain-containing protein n=1 Tax=Austropuccinia psidii MF-1 TaxID=1389203 RepID=A0A9Q3BMQ9_9BASI|nr:hypothetical protein [Austropuccinia psidii MF-1]